MANRDRARDRAGSAAEQERGGAPVECTAEVLEAIRARAVEAFNMFQHGGLEIAGVLYGRSDAERVAVLAAREFEWDHALGPGFTLSDADVERFRALAAPEGGFEAVGWYRSRTRSALELDAGDRALSERLFPGMGAVALMVKPTRGGPAEAFCCWKGANGEIFEPGESGRFTIEPMGKRRRAAQAPAEVRPEAAALPAKAVPAGPRWWRRAILVACAAAVGFAAVFALAAWFRAPRKLALEVSAASPGQVRIEWDRRSEWVRRGGSGFIEVRDGAVSTTLGLTAAQLQSSHLVYTLRSGLVTVRMHVDGPGLGAADERVDFVGPPAEAATQPAPVDAAPPREKAAEPAANSEPRETAGEAARPSEEPGGSSTAVATPPKLAPQEPAKKEDSQERAREMAREEAAASREVAHAAPRPFVAPGAKAQPERAGLPAAVDLPPPPVATPGVTQSAAPPLVLRTERPPEVRPAAARSGRLIWTGMVGRRGVIEIAGGRATTGTLAGALPGVPVRLRVAPAEFSRSGLVVYTDAARSNATESPSQANGWNQVSFLFDAERARELVVLEAPNPSNDYSRLVIRSDARSCAVIVVEWSTP